MLFFWDTSLWTLLKDNFFGGQNIFELKTVIFVALSIEYDFSSQKCLKSSARTKLLVENIQNSSILLLTYVLELYFIARQVLMKGQSKLQTKYGRINK